MPVKFADSSSNGSRDIQQQRRRIRHFRPFFNFSNCQPEVVSDVISSTVDVGMDICANFGDSKLKPLEASFAIFHLVNDIIVRYKPYNITDSKIVYSFGNCDSRASFAPA